MHVDQPSIFRRVAVHGCATIAGIALLAGCGPPPRVNIELRKQIQELQAQIRSLEMQQQADRATIEALQRQAETGVETLPQQRLDQLFTTHGIRFGRLTGGVDIDAARPGDNALRVYVVPIDQQAQPLKAAGSFVIEAFDLSRPDDPRLGRWEFDVEQAARNWYGELMQYTYAFTVEWDRPPVGDEVTVRVAFRDALTGREFAEQRVVRVNPPPPSG